MTSTIAPVAANSLAHNRNFSLLWFGEGVSVLGSMTTSVVLPLVAVTQFDAGPAWMGLLTAAIWLPWLLIGLPVGAWVDRLDPRRVMIGADFLAAAVIATVPISWALGQLNLAHLVGAAFGVGVATVFFRTAYLPLLPRLVDKSQFEAANARLVGTESAMQIVGPGLGGVLVSLVSAAYAVVVDVFSFLVSAFCLLRMRPDSLLPAPPPKPRESLHREIAEGVRVVAQDRILRYFTIQGGVSNFALTGYGALLVLFLVRDLDLSASLVGAVLAVGSVGGLIGASVSRRLSVRLGDARAMRLLYLIGGPPVVVIAAAQPRWGVLFVPLGLIMVGIGVVGANVIRSAFRLRYVPTHLMGRTTSTIALINFGTMPLAGVVAGWMGTHVGVRETIAIMATLHALSALSVFVSPVARLAALPTGLLERRGSGSGRGAGSGPGQAAG